MVNTQTGNTAVYYYYQALSALDGGGCNTCMIGGTGLLTSASTQPCEECTVLCYRLLPELTEIFQHLYNLTRSLLYLWSAIDQNIVMLYLATF